MEKIDKLSVNIEKVGVLEKEDIPAILVAVEGSLNKYIGGEKDDWRYKLQTN